MSKYNVENYLCEGILFLIVHPFIWRKDQKIKQNEKKKYGEKIAVKKNFYLPDILELYGWEVLAKNLKFCLDKAYSNTNVDDYFFIDSLENFI